MSRADAAEWRDQPIVVGCTGGSGSRVIAQILRALGVFMGDRCNPADDAIPFAKFDWHWGRFIVATSRDPHGVALRAARPLVRVPATYALQFTAMRHRAGYREGRWGWKHPHSYLLLPFLQSVYGRFRFVHLVRDGTDMATSSNQRQLRHYGDLFLSAQQRQLPLPVQAALFWSRANLAARDAGERLLGDRYVWLRLEDLCARPGDEVRTLATRLGIDARIDAMNRAVALPESPATLGRGREVDESLRRALLDAASPALAAFGYTQ